MTLPDPKSLRALCFDVFGTVVNWRATIAAEANWFAKRNGLELDGDAFARRWREGYPIKLGEINAGRRPRRRLDELHREILSEIAPEFGLASVPAEQLDQLNGVWHRLRGWPDAVGGIARLSMRYPVVALSNGDSDMLSAMAKSAGFHWDMVISAELSGAYKPQPAVYEKAFELLNAGPDEILMVAAHGEDLRGAARCGMRTAYIHRADEWGRNDPLPDVSEFDYSARDFFELAAKLGI